MKLGLKSALIVKNPHISPPRGQHHDKLYGFSFHLALLAYLSTSFKGRYSPSILLRFSQILLFSAILEANQGLKNASKYGKPILNQKIFALSITVWNFVALEPHWEPLWVKTLLITFCWRWQPCGHLDTRGSWVIKCPYMVLWRGHPYTSGFAS